jgi:hypothetical protein
MPNSAAQNFYPISFAAGTTVVAGVNAGLISSFTNQPFLTSGLWDLNVFLSADTEQDTQHIDIYCSVYIIDASASVNPQVPGTVIQDTSNPATIPPVALPANVVKLGTISNHATVTSTSVMEYTTSIYIPYTNISTFIQPYLQIQIYAYNNNTKIINGRVYYQSAASYTHLHTSLGLVGPTGPIGPIGIVGPTGNTGPLGPTGNTPEQIWSYVQSSTNIYYSNGSIGIRTATPDTNYALDVSGVIKTLGINNVSDYRIKENITSLSSSVDLPTIDKLRPVMYYNTLLKKPEYGFIAHEVQEIFPDIVVGNKDAEQYQTINYIPMFALLVKEIKELKREISILKAKLP